VSACVLRNVELDGARTNVRIANDRVAEIGAQLGRAEHEIDARGGALIPGLHDHHIHLFATAARMDSIDLNSATTKEALLQQLRAAAQTRVRGTWLRAIGYDDSRMGLISRDDLDLAQIDHPIRVQDRTGALWVLNSVALARVLDGDAPACVERDDNGRPTGRIWRGDAWLRTRIAATPPSLAALSRTLAAYGVTGVTDTSASNGAEEAALLATARTSGELQQSLYLMSGCEIPRSPHYEIGPLKILPDERDLPELDHIVERMRLARRLGRHIAVHCVTAAELVLALAAFEAVGATHGDRLEHGGMIPEGLISSVRALGLIVVTQPNFIHDRGDRYAREIDAAEIPDLYRLASLRAAGVPLAAGSDAPYGGLDPWRAIQAAMDRKTANGDVIGAHEGIPARDALNLYLGPAHDPAGGARKIRIGEPADLCLLRTPLATALAAPNAAHVRATFANGALIYDAG
jgi:predicted amidohydrolase YtcJ